MNNQKSQSIKNEDARPAPKVIFLRGISGSGKSTKAKELADANSVIIGRDIIRRELLGDESFRKYSSITLNPAGPSMHLEDFITKIENLRIARALNAGQNVILDNTNLRIKYLREYAKIANQFNAELKFEDIMDSDDIELCIARDLARAGSDKYIGEDTIRKQFVFWENRGQISVEKLKEEKGNRFWRLPKFPVQPYENPAKGSSEDFGAPIVIVDLDGTASLPTVIQTTEIPYMRSYFTPSDDEILQDRVDSFVQIILKNLQKAGIKIAFVSGREEKYRDASSKWITDSLGLPKQSSGDSKNPDESNWELFMRPTGDSRPDDIIKYEIFNASLRHRIIIGVFDDRKSTVSLWEALNLRVANMGSLNESF